MLKLERNRQIYIRYSLAGVFHRSRITQAGMKYIFSPVSQSQLLNKRQLIIYTEHHLSSYYLQWSLSQVYDKLTTLFTCSGSLFWLLWLSKDFLFCFGSGKLCVACSGFPTCFNAGPAVLPPAPLEGVSAMRSEPPLCVGWTGCAPQCMPQAGSPTETYDRHHHCKPLSWCLYLTFIAVFQLPLLDFCTKKVN